jgi:small-conductance mechanosensitive channel
VVFVDHADSALIFTLRYWTTIDHMVTTATNIRFEIDRLFNERGIEIAFPQRDIHIRSVVKGANAVVQNVDEGGLKDPD